MSVLEELKKLLECPICLELPLPGTVELGLCQNGHYVCLDCTNQILELSKRCPVCRQPSLEVLRGFNIATNAIELLTNNLVYQCSHVNCSEVMPGGVLEQHQKYCRQKPVTCPRLECFFYAPIDYFLDDKHKPCVETIKRRLPNSGWQYAFDLDLVYCFDTNIARVNERFNPVILVGKCCSGEIESQAYIGMVSRQGAILIYVGWLNKYDEVDAHIQDLKIEMSVYIHAESGKIGQFNCKRPIFQEEHINSNSDGISIARNTLYNWADWSHNVVCPECPGYVVRPHAHIQVNIKRG